MSQDNYITYTPTVVHNHDSYHGNTIDHLAIQRFREKFAGNYFETKPVLKFEGTYPEVIDHIASSVFSNQCNRYFHSDSHVELSDANLMIMISGGGERPFKSSTRSVYALVCGDLKRVRDFALYCSSTIEGDCPTISWYYNTSNGMRSKTFDLVRQNIHNEFYPYFKEGLAPLYKSFIESKANVLILLGPPGTGKTSFIRDLLFHSCNDEKLSAMTTYDEEVMREDSFFIQFFESRHHFLVLEDADILLTSREKDYNRVMNKILNASDGLISSDKKYIFSANLMEKDRIDSALMRPGRCYDVLEFRNLYRDEAEIAAKKIGRTLTVNKSDYALTDIFNAPRDASATRKSGRVGFIA